MRWSDANQHALKLELDELRFRSVNNTQARLWYVRILMATGQSSPLPNAFIILAVYAVVY